MGRYVSGDFEYKFAVGEQSSSLGILLETIADETEGEIITVERFTNDGGEICRMYVHDIKSFKNHVKKEFLSDFKEKTKEDWDNWSKFNEKFGEKWHDMNMLKLFIEKLPDLDEEQYEFDIEY